jgi:predicted RNase H-like nuclease (RuvC/YqgF family)
MYTARANVIVSPELEFVKGQIIKDEQYAQLPGLFKHKFVKGVDQKAPNTPIGETPEEKATREGAVKLAHDNKKLSDEVDKLKSELKQKEEDVTLFTEDNKKLSDENKQLAEQVKALQEDLAAANKEVEKLSKKAK